MTQIGLKETTKLHKLSHNLARLMFEKKIDAPALSQHTGIPTATINRMRADPDANPTLSSLLPLANYFGLSINQLIGVDDEIPHQARANDETVIPLLKMNEIGEDPPVAVTESVRTTAKVSSQAFATRMNSFAMAPTFPEGTLFIVEPELKPRNQDFVIVRLYGQKNASVKQIFIDGDDRFYKSINPDFGRLMHANNNEIIGVIVQAIVKYER